MMSRLCVSVWVYVRADMIYCALEGREEESRALKGLGPQGPVKVHERSERWVNIKEHPGSEIWTASAELAYRDWLFWQYQMNTYTPPLQTGVGGMYKGSGCQRSRVRGNRAKIRARLCSFHHFSYVYEPAHISTPTRVTSWQTYCKYVLKYA